MNIDLGWARVELLPSAPYSVQSASPVWVIGLAFERQRGVHAVANDHRQDFDAWPGALACTAPGVNVFSESPCGGEYLTLHVDAGMLEQHRYRPGQAPRTVFQGSRQAVALGMGLRRLLLVPQPDMPQLDEHAAGLLAHSLVLLDGPVPTAAGPTARDRQRLSDTLDRIEQELPKRLTLQTLAEDAGLPLLRFLRLFTQVVGTTPHAYISERRLHRARQLLRTSDSSLASVALDCGFTHQSHMGATFKERLGCSPGQYRRLKMQP